MTAAPTPIVPDLLTAADRAPRAAFRLGTPALAGVAAVALGLALDVNYGQYDPRALAWLAVAVAACLAAVGRASAGATTGAAVAAAAGRAGWLLAVVVQAAVLLAREPTVPGAMSAAALIAFRVAVLVIAACAAGAVLGPGGRGRARWVAGMVAAYLAAGLLVLRACPVPGVDVVVFQRDACAALLAGRSPYGITFPDVSPAGSDFYAPGVSVGGRLAFGFPYPPASLLLVLPAYLLGDFRLAGLLATAAAAALIAAARPSPRAAAAAALLLLTPSGFFVLWAGWTEPLAVGLLALVVSVAARARRPNADDAEADDDAKASGTQRDAGARAEPGAGGDAGAPSRRGLCPRILRYALRRNLRAGTRGHSPRREGAPTHLCVSGDVPSSGQHLPLVLALGLLLSVKQYAVLLLPLVGLLAPRGRRRLLLGALSVAAAASLPLALTDVGGFLRSVVWLQFRQPYRPDALSVLAPLHGTLPHAAASAVPLGLAAAAVAWAARHCPRTPAGFALAAAAVLLVFFATNKQAFCNYYHLVIGAMCCAIGAWGGRRGAGEAGEADAVTIGGRGAE